MVLEDLNLLFFIVLNSSLINCFVKFRNSLLNQNKFGINHWLFYDERMYHNCTNIDINFIEVYENI